MSFFGVGLGLRWDIMQSILDAEKNLLDFVELAPENWIDVGGSLFSSLEQISQKYPITCHGLSLSLGSPEPLDWEFLKKVKKFLKKIPVQIYSEHLSYSKCGNAHVYDLLPIPFCEEAIEHVSKRIRQVQDFLERKIAIENVSYYMAIAPKMDEATFINSIIEQSGCDLLLDVNNVYVNGFNHKYDPYLFLKKIRLDKAAYIHMAGHYQESESLIIDTHGEPIIDPVYDLFHAVIQKLPPVPVLLERDSNFGNMPQIFEEISRLKKLAYTHWVSFKDLKKTKSS